MRKVTPGFVNYPDFPQSETVEDESHRLYLADFGSVP
jgi:hypothetical protein